MRGTAHLGAWALQHDPDALRRDAEEILSRPPYTEEQDGLLSRALSWIGDQISGLLGDGLNAVFSLPFVPYLIAFIGLVILLVVVWRLTRGMTIDRSVAEVPREATSQSARQWLAEADEHLKHGRRREALRCRYAGLVAALVESAVIEDVPGRTVRELAAAVASSAPAIQGQVQTASARFERILYGRVDVGDDDLEVVAAAVEAVWARPAASVSALGERA